MDKNQDKTHMAMQHKAKFVCSHKASTPLYKSQMPHKQNKCEVFSRSGMVSTLCILQYHLPDLSTFITGNLCGTNLMMAVYWRSGFSATGGASSSSSSSSLIDWAGSGGRRRWGCHCH